jgi:hypothetical protein
LSFDAPHAAAERAAMTHTRRRVSPFIFARIPQRGARRVSR